MSDRLRGSSDRVEGESEEGEYEAKPVEWEAGGAGRIIGEYETPVSALEDSFAGWPVG